LTSLLSNFSLKMSKQGIIKGEVSLYRLTSCLTGLD
jgi:hypothetical protein